MLARVLVCAPLGTHADQVLICAWNPMLCPNWGFRYSDHIDFPYPNDADKLQLSLDAGIQVSQVNNWFSNKRNRKWAKDQKR